METIDKGFAVYQVYSSVCTRCKHFNSIELACKAFPEGIPDDLLAGNMEYDKILEGQNSKSYFAIKIIT